ncbi:DNA-3-methyladenine glycosylase family protein [Amycolatopsis sp. NPDC059090]|uniref:DNA-3-methyladenine glycosylase family protein n=1 Tax=unclassified Amycolatopsis TaxID=2618356 RepID=UPI0036712644
MTAPILRPIDLPTGEIAVHGDFDLSAASQWLAGAGPAGSFAAEPGVLRLAFPVEGTWTHAGAAIRQRSPGTVEVGVAAPVEIASRVVAQVSRMLSLDVDESGFAEVASRDSVVRRLQARHSGARPVLYSSPYEAACWAVLTQGMRARQAMRLREQLAVRHGRQVGDDGPFSFPTPQILAELDDEPSVGPFRLARLRAVARAATDGRLDTEELLALSIPDAMTRLCAIPGIGAFSAEQILLHGAGHPDLFPRLDTQLHQILCAEYALPPDTPPDELEPLTEDWWPYRSWVAHLFRLDRLRTAVSGEVAD